MQVGDDDRVQVLGFDPKAANTSSTWRADGPATIGSPEPAFVATPIRIRRVVGPRRSSPTRLLPFRKGRVHPALRGRWLAQHRAPVADLDTVRSVRESGGRVVSTAELLVGRPTAQTSAPPTIPLGAAGPQQVP